MLKFTRAEIQKALDYLCCGGANGGPLSYTELMWELNIEQNGSGFGSCLRLAGSNPDIFPAVLTAPFFRRELVRRQNIFLQDGCAYVMAAGVSCDAAGAPTEFYYGWQFPAATLAD